MTECCANCKHKMKLVKYDYSKGGCTHTDYDGFACLAFASEGQVTHMVGADTSVDACEMYRKRW